MNEKGIGAALVVGGGIAGMQAALDLAETEVKVYLLEHQSAIGGHMAQLDKTFPTNDCAACILSPKMASVGRHPNIELLFYGEVEEVSGVVGNFRVRVRKKPRYVRVEDCTGCGECVAKCPVEVLSEFEVGLAKRKAIYRRFPQAVPTAFVIDKKPSPCKVTCPAHIPVQGYIALIAEGKFDEAVALIRETMAFPGVCGRVCNRPCEAECKRKDLDEPLAIAALKRFASDYAAPVVPTPVERTKADKVAIVGSGPAGLSAAYDLVRKGYGVTVFEALPVAGGMMTVGIPEYRLPRKVLESEIDYIKGLGVEIRTSTPLGDGLTLADLNEQGYAAIFLAIGAHKSQSLRIPGEDLKGVIYSIPFLRDVNLGRKVEVGERVAVIGGGNSAIDAARVVLRSGAREVTIVYRRSRQEMPALTSEVDEAEREGIALHLLASPTKILGQDGKVKAIECIRMELGEPDESGRRRPLPIEGSEFTMDVDMMMLAIGQAPDLSCLPEELEISRWGTLAVEPDTLATSMPGVFAGGDAVTGAATVIEAVAAGKVAAESIDCYLQGKDLKEGRIFEMVRAADIQVEIPPDVEREARQEMPVLSIAERADNVKEIELGFTPEQAIAEAKRCLNCAVCSECRQCMEACEPKCIDLTMKEEYLELEVGAIILAPGFQPYDARLASEFGFGRYANVITSLQFERLLSASGPTGGHAERISDGVVPKNIAFLQCIGSRDQTHDYCSAVCCMYATKEAVVAKEHIPGVDCHVFMMDMRAFGKGYEDYYRKARDDYGVKYTRCRISSLKEDPRTRDLVLKYWTEDGEVTEEPFQMVVLSVGMEMSPEVRELGRRLGIELDDHGFCQTISFNPVQTTKPGIYACGPFTEPKDIPESVTQGSAAAAQAGTVVGEARGTLVQPQEYPPEVDVSTQEPRVGVFVCHCGRNIGGFLDVPAVTEYAKSLPGVVHAEHNLYSCSPDTISLIRERIREFGLNRVVVAACTPLTHEPLFQDTLRQEGLNPYLFEMVNIRNQCSWVHSEDWGEATWKAKELVRMSVARARLLEPLHRVSISPHREAVIIGGGVAGMNAALTLAEQGLPVHLIERSKELGGNLRRLHYTLEGSDPQAYLRELIRRVEENRLITLHRETELVELSGFIGDFSSRLRSNGRDQTIQHGAVIVATGGKEYRGSEYLYGQDPRVLTLQELEEKLATDSGEIAQANNLVFIQCVGPSDRYCSRICCSAAIKNALKIKELNPHASICILHRDITVYGFKESYYTRAREQGILFLSYGEEEKPRAVRANGHIEVYLKEQTLDEEIMLRPDFLILSSGIVPAEGAQDLASTLKVPLTLDGFFLEAHIKLRPLDFASEGIFMAGLAHYPKHLEETIAQAQAAAARAATILTKEELLVGGVVAVVEPEKCTGCLTCVRICPYNVPSINGMLSGVGGIRGVAEIEPAQCHGCGICAAECPAEAIQLMHYRDVQVEAEIEALFGVP